MPVVLMVKTSVPVVMTVGAEVQDVEKILGEPAASGEEVTLIAGTDPEGMTVTVEMTVE